MSLARYLARLGYGTRKECERLFASRRVTRDDGMVVRERDQVPHEALRLDGHLLDPPPGSVILLNKPIGYVCSTSDRPPLVYDLLPSRFRARDPVMATVGRLDAETSGLLLLTDDGPLNHRLTSPRSHLPKCYEVELAEPLQGHEAALFGAGTLMLQGENDPLLPATLEVLAPRRARLTVREGRYHQVRRMFAAAGNHVVSLQRVAFGPLTLGAQEPAAWRVLTAAERETLEEAVREARRER